MIIYRKIVLDQNDLERAKAHTVTVMGRKVEFNRADDHGGGNSGRDLPTRHTHTLTGTLGEMAGAKFLKRPWTPGGVRISKGDIDNKIEVRHTKHSRTGNLLIYKTDSDAALVVFIVGEFPIYRFVGVIRAGHAKHEGKWRDDCDTPCWWVSQKTVKDYMAANRTKLVPLLGALT